VLVQFDHPWLPTAEQFSAKRTERGSNKNRNEWKAAPLTCHKLSLVFKLVTMRGKFSYLRPMRTEQFSLQWCKVNVALFHVQRRVTNRFDYVVRRRSDHAAVRAWI